MREREIVELLRGRSERGVEELLRHYGPLMRYIIAPILPDAQDREECLSEAAMRVWDKIELFDPGRGKWNVWLTAVTRSVALNHLRRGRRREPEAAEELRPEMPSPGPTPEESVLRQELREALAKALGSFDPADRTLFYRKYYYLQPTAQIAAELGLTARAVEGRLYRIKKRLRAMLGGAAHD